MEELEQNEIQFLESLESGKTVSIKENLKT
jgi:hypothetical protein